MPLKEKANKEPVVIKGTVKGLIIYLDTDLSWQEIKEGLVAKLASGNSFFRGAAYNFWPPDLPWSEEEKAVLHNLCREAGLHHEPGITPPKITKTSLASALPELAATTAEEPKEEDQEEKSELPTLFIGHSLRSGTRIRYPGNVAILGDVNPGAEVVAGGHIVVMGTLRGLAHAGAYGWEEASITAYRLEPTQIRIASYVARSPDPSYRSMAGPERARLQDGQIIVEEYVTPGTRRRKK